MSNVEVTSEEYKHQVKRVNAIAKILKTQLLTISPFHGHVLNWLCQLHVAEDKSAIAYTDGEDIYFNPDKMTAFTDNEVRFILLHEMYHVIFMHCVRAKQLKGTVNQTVWNYACDYVVNYELYYIREHNQFKQSKTNSINFDIAKGCLLMRNPDGSVKDLTGISAEEIYNQLLKDGLPRDTNQGQGEKKSNSAGGNNSDSSSSNTQNPRKIVFGDVQNESKQDNSDKQSGSGIESGEEQDGSSAVAGEPSGFFSDLKPDANKDPYRIQDTVKQVLRQAKMKSYDLAGASLGSFLQSTFKKTNVRWDIYLRKFLTSKITDDDSYDSPNRKYLPYDIILPGPGAIKEQIDNVFVFLDTSGSISSEELQVVLNNVYTICTNYDCTMSCAFWHTSVYGSEVNTTPDDFVKKFSSIEVESGGTDVGCVFDYIQKNRVASTAFLIFTDGCFDKVSVPRKIARKTIIAVEESNTPESWLSEIGKVVSYKKDGGR